MRKFIRTSVLVLVLVTPVFAGEIPYGVTGEIPNGTTSSSSLPTVTEVLISLIAPLLP
jgi:hypothetical protein